MTSFGFALPEEDGSILGADVDGVVSDRTDPDSCRRVDQVAPDGTPGIDNELGDLWVSVEELIGDKLEGILETAVKEGSIMILLELEGVDDLQNDDCVTVHIFRGAGRPDLGTDFEILQNQTFDIHEESPHSVAVAGRIEDGVLTAGPFDAAVPILVYTVFFTARVHDAQLRLDLNEDGTGSGFLGGGMEVEQLMEVGEHVAGMDSAAAQVFGLFEFVLDTKSDLARGEDGCEQISGALAFGTTKAFLFDDVTRPDEIVSFSDGPGESDVVSLPPAD
jgi:hypothetical protein